MVGMSNLAWDEPRNFRRNQNAREQRVFSVESAKTMAVIAGCLIGLRVLVGLNPRPSGVSLSWPNAILLALVVGFVGAIVAPWLIARIGMARVILSEKGINHNVMRGIGWQINFYPWSSVSGVQMSEEDGQSVLRVALKSGSHLVVALPEQPSGVEISAFVARHTSSG